MFIDTTDVALEWAERNVKDNSQVSELIEIRKVKSSDHTLSVEDPHDGESSCCENKEDLTLNVDMEGKPLSSSFGLPADVKRYHGSPILLGVVRDDEKFDFCMCNPPFFETIEEAGLNPKTSCGGTPEEMVCPGGEKAFITRIIEDSSILKHTFRYYFFLDALSCCLFFVTQCTFLRIMLLCFSHCLQVVHYNGWAKSEPQVPNIETMGGWSYHCKND